MELILWRHAEAEEANGKPDSERNLTKKGRKQAERVAAWLEARIDSDWRILVSPAKRTLQTVEPLDQAFETSEAIGTATSVEALLRATGWPDAKRNVLVVGHQPTLGEVAAELLETDGGLSVRKGAIWWFTSRTRDGGRETLLKAVLSPDLIDAAS